MATRLINPEQEFRRYRRRMELAAVLAGLLLLVLFARFVWLQVVQFERYHALAEHNRIALVPVPPSRGLVYDRHGTVLAQNYAAYTLEITPAKVEDMDGLIDQLATIVHVDAGDRRRFRRLLAEARDFESIPLRNQLSEEEAARFAVHRYRFPGVEVRARLVRQYPFGETFAHVVGYIGRISQRDAARLEAKGQTANYRGSDHIGKLGLEASYEAWLHGRTGIDKVETDSGGRAVRVLSRTPPVPGHNLWLHLDARLQQVAEQVFGAHRGALVALDPRTGGVLALVSRPGFDPNLFIDGIDQASWEALNHPFYRPLINRALRGVYPPGSTIKPFMALAALDMGLRRPEDSIDDRGYFTLPGSSHRFRDWKRDGHGIVDMKKSVAVSCDVYYYDLAVDMGIRRMTDYLAQFGLGRKTGVDLDGELPGLLPTPEWKQRRFNLPWWPGETVIAGIGQGYMLANPLQLAKATMILANRGVIYKPQLVRAWQDPRSGRTVQLEPTVLGRLELDAEHLRVVQESMVAVMLPGGTAASSGAGAPYLIAGKTGTSQVKGIRQGELYDEAATALHHRPHALFVAYAPADDPRIVLAVMVENGGSGSAVAAPMARQVMDFWLLGRMPPPAAAPATPDTPATPARSRP